MRTNLDLLMYADASKDALCHSSNGARGIPDAFVDTNLYVVFAEEDGLTAKESGSGLGRDTGARAPL